MLCAVYKSPAKADTYLYVEKRDDFSKVPTPLLDMFGVPIFVILINLESKSVLASVDKQKLQDALSEQGFYLQLPAEQENLLTQHREWLSASGQLTTSSDPE